MNTTSQPPRIFAFKSKDIIKMGPYAEPLCHKPYGWQICFLGDGSIVHLLYKGDQMVAAREPEVAKIEAAFKKQFIEGSVNGHSCLIHHIKRATLKTEKWIADMRALKLRYIQKTAPGFYEASGGDSMATKPFSEKNDNKLASAIASCLSYCGGVSELQYNFTLVKGLNGYEPIFNEAWKPVRVIAAFEGRRLVIDTNKRCRPAARTTAAELYLMTPNFETFSMWFVSHFPKTAWAQLTKGDSQTPAENPSLVSMEVQKGPQSPVNSSKIGITANSRRNPG